MFFNQNSYLTVSVSQITFQHDIFGRPLYQLLQSSHFGGKWGFTINQTRGAGDGEEQNDVEGGASLLEENVCALDGSLSAPLSEAGPLEGSGDCDEMDDRFLF